MIRGRTILILCLSIIQLKPLGIALEASITITSTHLAGREVELQCCHYGRTWDATWTINDVTKPHYKGVTFDFDGGLVTMYDLPDPLPAEGPKCLILKVSGNVDQNITASCRSFFFNSSSEVGLHRAIFSDSIRVELTDVHLNLRKINESTVSEAGGKNALLSYSLDLECQLLGTRTMDISWLFEKEYLNSDYKTEVIKVAHHINGVRSNLSDSVMIFAEPTATTDENPFGCEQQQGYCFKLVIKLLTKHNINPFHLNVACEHNYPSGNASSNTIQVSLPLEATEGTEEIEIKSTEVQLTSASSQSAVHIHLLHWHWIIILLFSIWIFV